MAACTRSLTIDQKRTLLRPVTEAADGRGAAPPSVVGLETPEYMNDADNHEVWSVGHFVSDFPFVTDFLNVARPDQTAFFADGSGTYVIEAD